MSDHEVWRERVEQARQFLRESEELVEDAKVDYRQAVYSLGHNTPIGAREEIVNDIYWNCPEIKTTDVEQAFGFHRAALSHGKGIIKSFYSAELSCPTCGVPHEITSRNKLTEMRRTFRKNQVYASGGKATECNQCRDIRSAERDKRWEAEREARQHRLYELRTMPYKEYLQTPEWQAQRLRTLRFAKYSCQICNTAETTLDVHHRTYERRGHEYHRDLVVLCRGCHGKFHDKIGEES